MMGCFPYINTEYYFSQREVIPCNPSLMIFPESWITCPKLESSCDKGQRKSLLPELKANCIHIGREATYNKNGKSNM